MIGTPVEQKTVNRSDLVEDIKNHQTFDKIESGYISRFLELLQVDRCFYRDCFPGHITGSALLLNQNGDKILMNHHKTLDKWLSFGGHCDGEEDVLSVAIRETMEESGMTAFKPVSATIIDIDIHTIPANPNKNEPEHEHFDIRYLMQMQSDQQPIISDESLNLQWMTFDDALKNTNNDGGMHRLIEKTKTILA